MREGEEHFNEFLLQNPQLQVLAEDLQIQTVGTYQLEIKSTLLIKQ